MHSPMNSYPNNKNIIELEHVEKTFADMTVFEDLSLHVKRGELVVLLGSSGSGKSTIFNLISGFIRPTKGKVEVHGSVGYMQQKDLLLPWKTVEQNVGLPLKLRGDSKEEVRAKVEKYLPIVGLEGAGQKYPSQLSGGMRQRASFLRTVLTAEDILLLDEAFGSLDSVTRMNMQTWLLEMKEKLDYTIFLITHDIEEAVLLADRIYVISKIPATIEREIVVDFDREDKKQRLFSPELLKLKKEILAIL